MEEAPTWRRYGCLIYLIICAGIGGSVGAVLGLSTWNDNANDSTLVTTGVQETSTASATDTPVSASAVEPTQSMPMQTDSVLAIPEEPSVVPESETIVTEPPHVPSTVIPLEPAERLMRVLFMQTSVETSLRSMADEIQRGEMDGMTGMFGLMALGGILQPVQDALEYTYGEPLTEHAATAREQQSILRSVVLRWIDNEITSADVASALGDLNTETTLITYMELLRANGYRDAELSNMLQRLEQSLEEAFDQAFEETSP